MLNPKRVLTNDPAEHFQTRIFRKNPSRGTKNFRSQKSRSEYRSKKISLKMSVVIPTKNRRKHLEECLDSLFKSNLRPDEVIVVDMCSTDGTQKIAEVYPIKLLSVQEQNRQRQRNSGLLATNGDIVVFLDDDVIIDEFALEYVMLAYGSPDVGGVGGRVLPYGGAKDFWVPACGNLIGKVRGDGLVIGNFDIPSQVPIEVDCFQGCFMSFRRKALLKCGGFDENYQSFFRGDDTDVSFAVKKLGYKLLYQPNAIVWHKMLGKSSYGTKNWIHNYVRGSTYFYFKNIFPQTKRYLPWFFLRLLFPPKEYVLKSGMKIHLSPLLPLIALQGFVDGILPFLRMEIA